MRMTIDEKIEEDLKHCSFNGVKYSDYVKEHYIPKDQYEARLKADMVAVLTDLQLEIEELRLDRPLMSRGYECYRFEDKTPTEIKQECCEIIQQKINALRGEKDEKK